MLRHIRFQLRQDMPRAHQRLDRRGLDGVNRVLALALLTTLLGLLLLHHGDYHSGFWRLQLVSHSMLPDDLWLAITRLGDGRILILLGLFFARKRPEIFWALIVSAIFAALYSRGLKVSVDALRPPAVLEPSQLRVLGPILNRHSFPSGHTVTAFMFFGVLMVYARSGLQVAGLLGIAGLAGLSRIALGVHWPMDVLAGAFGGLCAAAIGAWVSYYWRAGLRPGVHLVLVTLLALYAFIALFRPEGGNPEVPWLVIPLAIAAGLRWLVDYALPSRQAG